ncbi:MAG TPA: hypothetical protein VFQ22_06060 [Longimicrobiales bacterium]|nr:hypothetical protein [Longimicrobiales bacterium]
MAHEDSRRGAVDLGVILMVLAFVVVGGFLYWLSLQVEQERATVAVQDTAAVETDPRSGSGGTPAVTVDDLQMRADSLLGQSVRLTSVEVESALGRQGFWVNPGPFLVSYSAELVADSTTVPPQSVVDVVGTVRSMSDSVTAAWTAAGTISEGDAIAASFSSHYLEATSVEVAPTGGAQ